MDRAGFGMTPVPFPADWLVPDWPAPSQVRAVCTTRGGGVSAGPWASFNLGNHVGDRREAVRANREQLANHIGARPVFLQQVHGCGVTRLNSLSAAGTAADASVSTERGVACAVLVADCLPLLLTTADGAVVAAAHAGWRGLVGGVFEATFKQFLAEVSTQQQDFALKNEPIRVLAWLGPCIGQAAFEVGPEVREAFLARNALASRHFKPGVGDRWLADLAGLARQTLQTLGVHHSYGNDSSPAWCTVQNASRFFSYRRDGVTGRFAAAVWRV